MIPNIMRKEIERLMPGGRRRARVRQAEKESAAITGFTSAIAAFGAFFIPKAYGTSIDLDRRRAGRALGLLGLLHHLRRRSPGRSTPAAAACFTMSSAAASSPAAQASE